MLRDETTVVSVTVPPHLPIGPPKWDPPNPLIDDMPRKRAVKYSLLSEYYGFQIIREEAYLCRRLPVLPYARRFTP